LIANQDAAIGASDAAGSQIAAPVGAASSEPPDWIVVQDVQGVTGGATSSNQQSANVSRMIDAVRQSVSALDEHVGAMRQSVSAVDEHVDAVRKMVLAF